MRASSKLLLLLLATTLPSLASSPVTVSASSAIRVAWVERGARADESTELQRAFAPVFRMSLEGIYGAATKVEFVSMNASKAADKLAYGEVDAVLQFSPRISRRIRDSGAHVLRAESVTQPGRYVAFLVLPEVQSGLQDLLANAFAASINNYDVRVSLDDTPDGVELASW